MAFHEAPMSAALEDVALSPLSPAARGRRSDDGGAEDHDHGKRSDSTSLVRLDSADTPAIVNVRESYQRARHQSLAPSIGNDHTSIYWYTPAKMISGFLFGFACIVFHHVFYMTRDGGKVPSSTDQLWTLRAGAVFAFLVSASLVSSARNAYTQWLWLTLKNKHMSIKGLDAAFQADLSPHAVINGELLWKMPMGSLVAIIALSIPIASLITPNTLSVHQGEYLFNTTANVTLLDMSTNDPSRNISQPGRFAVWATDNVQDDGKYFSARLTAPRTIISRLTDAAASGGNILPDTPPYLNSTWVSQFYGPIVQCEAATTLEAKVIDEFIEAQMAASQATEINQEINYFAFVPVKNSSAAALNITTPFPGYNISAILGDRLEEPLNATNQLWMAYSKYADGSNCYSNVPSIIRQHTVCTLWNASYLVNFTFENGIQNITVANLDLLKQVDYPTNDPTIPADLTQHAYSAYMWAFSDQIIGFMRLYQEKLSNGTGGTYYSQIQTPIQDTVLLGSSDLDVFFDRRHLRLEGKADCNLSDQRLQDIGLARNEPLEFLIPELSANITLSFFSSNLLSPPVEITVTTKSTVNFYQYNWRDLLISYVFAIAFALLANILGAVAFYRNRVCHDRSFSALLSSTRDAELANIFEKPRLGKLPLPDDVARTHLTFVPDRDGDGKAEVGAEGRGWSLELARDMNGRVIMSKRRKRREEREGSKWIGVLKFWKWRWGTKKPPHRPPPHGHPSPHPDDAAEELMER